MPVRTECRGLSPSLACGNRCLGMSHDPFKSTFLL